MKRMTQTAILALATACGMGISAPASAANICFAFQDLETEFWVAGHKAIVSTLKEAGHTVIERNAQEETRANSRSAHPTLVTAPSMSYGAARELATCQSAPQDVQ